MGKNITFSGESGMNVSRVIVSVSRAGDGAVHDLELPVDLPVAALSNLVAYFLGWAGAAWGSPVSFQVVEQATGRELDPNLSLAQSGVWDGAWLVFHGQMSTYTGQASKPEPDGKIPLVRWRTLDGLGDQSPARRTGTDGFAWKRVDEQ